MGHVPQFAANRLEFGPASGFFGGVVALAAGAALFFTIALASQLALFAGCVPRDADGRFRPIGWIGCLSEPAEIYRRLEVIAWPALGLSALTFALCAAVGASWLIWRGAALRRASRYASG